MSKHTVVDGYLKGRSVDLEPAEEHLESCARCRKLLGDDPAVGRARIKVMSQVINEVSVRPKKANGRGPLVALGAAAGVLLLAVPAFLLASLPAAEPETAADPAPLPGAEAPLSESFVLTFDVGSSDLGWLLWKDPMEWTAVRLSRAGELRYRVGATGGGMFVDTGDDATFNDDDLSSFDNQTEIEWAEAPLQLLSRDTEIPWAQLVGSSSPADQWTQLTGGGAMSEAVPGNGLAASAASHEDMVAEFNNAGRLVAWNDYRATAFEVRTVTEIELQSFVSTFIEYAEYLSKDAATEVKVAFADAWVTKTEYEAGAQRAVDCATEAGATASYSLPSVQAPAVIDLGGQEKCGELYFNPLDALWKLQVRTAGVTGLERADAILDDSPERLEMIDSQKGARVGLASGNGWNIDIAPRGPGWCIYLKQGSSSSEGCTIPSEWQLPDLLTVDIAVFPDGAETMTGVVSDEVMSIVANFVDGSEIRAETLSESVHPLRAFGFGYEFDDNGLPLTIDLYDKEGALIATLDLQEHVCGREGRGGSQICGGE